MASINFSLAGVQLLIKGGSYSRAAFINFRAIPHSAIHKNCNVKGWFMGIVLQIIKI